MATAKSLGMTSLYWAVDPSDWDSATWGTGSAMTSHIVSTVEHNVRPGSIILSHDIYADTVNAYTTLMPWLKARYKLVALPV